MSICQNLRLSQKITKIRPGQKPSETKDIAHGDIAYPIYLNHNQKVVILDKPSTAGLEVLCGHTQK